MVNIAALERAKDCTFCPAPPATPHHSQLRPKPRGPTCAGYRAFRYHHYRKYLAKGRTMGPEQRRTEVETTGTRTLGMNGRIVPCLEFPSRCSRRCVQSLNRDEGHPCPSPELTRFSLILQRTRCTGCWSVSWLADHVGGAGASSPLRRSRLGSQTRL